MIGTLTKFIVQIWRPSYGALGHDTCPLELAHIHQFGLFNLHIYHCPLQIGLMLHLQWAEEDW